MTKHRANVLLPLLAVLPISCGGGARPELPPGVMEAAREQFKSVCFTCHGATGHGDGPGAAELDPKPRSFADATWQDSVTDAHIRNTIVFGGAGVRKSEKMPAHPQYKTKPQMLAGLVEVVRGFRGK